MSEQAASRFVKPFNSLKKLTRSSEWWEFKGAPVMATAYLSAWQLKIPLSELWFTLIFLIFSLSCAAGYANIINNISDLDADRVCGKYNFLENRSKKYKKLVLSAPLLGGLIALFIIEDFSLKFIYLSIWLVWTLYSLKPFRLKEKGIAGIVADSAGAHLLPTLFALQLIAPTGPLNIDFMLPLLSWSFLLGIRNIVWHQLADKENDEKSKLATFVTRHKESSIINFCRYIIFPLEILCFLFLMQVTEIPFVAPLLIFYVLMEGLRWHFFKTNIVICVTKTPYRVFMHEFYELFFPVLFIAATYQYDPNFHYVLMAHFILFNIRLRQLISDLMHLARWQLYDKIFHPEKQKY